MRRAAGSNRSDGPAAFILCTLLAEVAGGLNACCSFTLEIKPKHQHPSSVHLLSPAD